MWQQLCSSVIKHGDRVTSSKTESQPPSPADSGYSSVSSRNKSENESRKLRLRYWPDCIGAAEARWPKQMCAFVKLHAHQYDRIVVVRCMPQNKCTKAIHMILKRACDLSARVPSLSINSRRLQQLVRDYPRKGVHIAAKSLTGAKTRLPLLRIWSPASQCRTLPLPYT